MRTSSGGIGNHLITTMTGIGTGYSPVPTLALIRRREMATDALFAVEEVSHDAKKTNTCFILSLPCVVP